MLLSLLLAACALDDRSVGDGADPSACECDPGDSGATTDSVATDSGCVDTDTADTTVPCADTATTTGR